MTPTTQLVDAQLHHSLFEALPARLCGCIRLIGRQSGGDLALGDSAQQGIGIISRLTGNEHRTDQLQWSRREPTMTLPQIGFELLDPASISRASSARRARLTRLLIVPTAHSQTAAASS